LRLVLLLAQCIVMIKYYLVYTFLAVLLFTTTKNVQAQNQLDSICANTTKAKLPNAVEDYFEALLKNKDKSQIAALKNTVAKINQPIVTIYYQYYTTVATANFSTEAPSFIKAMDVCAKQVEKLGLFESVAGKYYYISELYRRLGENNKSLEYKLSCLDALKKDPKGNYYNNYLAVFYIAGEYYKFNDYPKAIQLSLLANKISKNADFVDKGFAILHPNLLGMSYLKNNQLDSALYWLQLNLEVAKQQKSEEWIGITIGNLGKYYLLKNNIAQAKQFLTQGIAICKQANLWDNVVAFTSSLITCYMRQDSLQPIAQLLQTAESGLKKMEMGWFNYDIFLDHYSVAKAYYTKANNGGLAKQAADSLAIYQNLTNQNFDKNKKALNEAQVAYRNKELEAELAQKNAHTTKLLLYLSLAGFSILIIAGIGLFTRKNLQLKIKQQQTEALQLQSQQALALAQAKINDFVHVTAEKNNLIEKFSNELQSLRTQNQTITDAQFTQVEQLKTLAILTDDDWQNFKTLFEKVHPNFLKNLVAKNNQLTQAETRYLVFLKLGLSPKEMSAMLGVGPEAIRNIKFRVKKKLNFEEATDFDAFLAKL
jgi:hypothetical protein